MRHHSQKCICLTFKYFFAPITWSEIVLHCEFLPGCRNKVVKLSLFICVYLDFFCTWVIYLKLYNPRMVTLDFVARDLMPYPALRAQRNHYSNCILKKMYKSMRKLLNFPLNLRWKYKKCYNANTCACPSLWTLSIVMYLSIILVFMTK